MGVLVRWVELTEEVDIRNDLADLSGRVESLELKAEIAYKLC